MLKRITRLATVAVFLALAAVTWLAWDTFFNTSASDSSTTSTESSSSEAYTDLEIFEDPSGNFAARVTIRNNTSRDNMVLAKNNIYDGEQSVGELFDSVTLKPQSESVLEITGYDEFTEYTDARVHLTGLPE
jgi:hypothetical protein